MSILHIARHTEYMRSRSRDCGSLLVALKLRQPKSWCTLKALTARPAATTEQAHENQYEQPTWPFHTPRQDAGLDRAEPFHDEGAIGASERHARGHSLTALQLRELAKDVETEHDRVKKNVDTPVGIEREIRILRPSK